MHRKYSSIIYSHCFRNHLTGTRAERVRITGGSSLVFIDSSSLRRSTNAAAQEPHSTATTASCLARAFGIVIRQIADILSGVGRVSLLGGLRPLPFSQRDAIALQTHLESRLKPTWDWLVTVMDATEAQLRYDLLSSCVVEWQRCFFNIHVVSDLVHLLRKVPKTETRPIQVHYHSFLLVEMHLAVDLSEVIQRVQELLVFQQGNTLGREEIEIKVILSICMVFTLS